VICVTRACSLHAMRDHGARTRVAERSTFAGVAHG